MSDSELYSKYVKQSRDMAIFGSIMAHLGWDQQVMLSSKGHSHRQEQMVALSALLHKKGTDSEWGTLLKNLIQKGQSSYSPHQWKNLTHSLRNFEESIKIPEELVTEMAKLASEGHNLWLEAKKNNHFPTFAPVIKKFIAFRRKIADIVYPDMHPYDVCLDSFERNYNRNKIDTVFSELKAGLVPLVKELQNSQHAPAVFPKTGYCTNQQRELNRFVSAQIGLDYEKARIDESAHPFSGGGHSTDVRITTRYESDSFFSSLSSTVHETGHGMYEQGLPEEYSGLPVGESLGFIVHESQSLLMERMVCQGPSFWNFFGEKIRSAFPDALGDLSNEEMYRRCNRVDFGLIRIDADELTYPLHIILRYEIEKALFDNEIRIDELPEAWNAKCHELLGFIPPSDALGILQDVHWSDGSFGYFPMYTLGAMYGAQFYQACSENQGDLEDQLSNGNFEVLNSWLRKNIHQMGRLLDADELLHQVTGKDLDCAAYLDYLGKKYRAIYKL